MTGIIVIGPGAIGCAVGAALIEAGHDVVFDKGLECVLDGIAAQLPHRSL